jgi:hypothetical protein
MYLAWQLLKRGYSLFGKKKKTIIINQVEPFYYGAINGYLIEKFIDYREFFWRHLIRGICNIVVAFFMTVPDNLTISFGDEFLTQNALLDDSPLSHSDGNASARAKSGIDRG